MEYGLSRIILIDSYLPGRLYIIDLNGHTNVMGENDMGKTTLIKLAVLFYGESPVKLGIKRNDALKLDGFAEHYLPRSGSYVIFEYLSASEPRMLVLSSLPDTKEHYRRTFVKSGFKREDFWTTDSESPLKAEHWLKEAPLKYKVEQCPSGDAQTRKLLEGRDPHFSMVPTRLNLTRMKSLMTSMFSRNAGHTELTKIIEEWARSDLGGEFSRQLETISVPRAELEAWVANYRNYRAIERAKERFSILGNLITTHDGSLEQATGLFALSKLKKDVLTTQLEDEAVEFKLKRDQLQSVIDTQNDSLLQLRKDYKECSNSNLKLTSEQSSLDQTLQALKEKVPANFSELIASNTGILARIAQIEAEIRDITAGQKQVNEWKVTQLNEAEQLLIMKLQAIKESIQFAESEKHKSINEHNKQLDQQLKLRQVQLETDKSIMTKRLTTQTETVSLLKGRLISPSLSQEEMQKQKELKAEVDALENARELASIEREEANKATVLAKREYDAEYSKVTIVTRRLKDKEDELEELMEILNAQDGSLLSFLKQQVPGWQETHGRSLKPEVLRAKGLSPKLNVSADPHSIFGIEIDVAALPEHYLDLGDDNKLREQMIALEEEVAALNKEQEKLNNNCIRLTKKIGEAERRASLANSDYYKKNKLYAQFKTDLSTEDARLSELFRTHQKRLESELAIEESGYHALLTQVDTVERQLKALQEEAFATKLEFERTAEITFQHTKNSLTEKELFANAEHHQRVTQINEQYHRQLKEEGIDGGYVAALTAEQAKLKRLDTSCKQIESAREVLLKYQVETYAPRYPRLVEELTATTEKLQSIVESARLCEAKLSQLNAEIRSLEDNFERSKSRHKRSLAQIEDSVLIFTHFDALSPPILKEKYSIEQICQHFKELRGQLCTSVDHVRSLNTELLPLFKSPGTGAFNYLTSDPGNSDDALQIAKRLHRYLDGGFYQVDYTSFIQSTQNFDRVTLYVDYLRQFKTKINRYNRGLNDHMERAVAFNGIDHLEVDITFQYSDRNDWALVNDIAEQYLIWKSTKNVGRLDSSQVELPQQGLVDAIVLYLSTPNSDNMSVNELYKHIDFAVKIIDNGKEKVARSFLDILSSKGGASSNGTSYLILITIFIGILNMMRNGRAVHFTWALDELADISPNNITQLLKLLEDNCINLISACTVASESVYLSFNKTYTIEYDRDTGEKIIADENVLDPIEALLSDISTCTEQNTEEAHA